MTYLAIDFGSKRIGLALSDPEHRFAIPFKTLSEPKTWMLDIKNIVQEKNIERVLVGVPYSLKGQTSISTQAALDFMAKIAASILVPVDAYNEVMTTQMALKQQRAAGVSQKAGRAHIDALAACNILESYLQRQRHQ